MMCGPMMCTGRRITVSTSGCRQMKFWAYMSTSMRSRTSEKRWLAISGASSVRKLELSGLGP